MDILLEALLLTAALVGLLAALLDGRHALRGGAPAPRLTLGKIMAAIAVVGLGMAWLSPIPAAALTTGAVGILVAEGARRPPITARDGARGWLPWTVWALALALCPVAITVLGFACRRVGPPAFAYFNPRPWAAVAVERLGYAHVGVSSLAAGVVVLLERPGSRWPAWIAIVVVGIVTWVLAGGATMLTTGVEL